MHFILEMSGNAFNFYLSNGVGAFEWTTSQKIVSTKRYCRHVNRWWVFVLLPIYCWYNPLFFLTQSERNTRYWINKYQRGREAHRQPTSESPMSTTDSLICQFSCRRTVYNRMMSLVMQVLMQAAIMTFSCVCVWQKKMERCHWPQHRAICRVKDDPTKMGHDHLRQHFFSHFRSFTAKLAVERNPGHSCCKSFFLDNRQLGKHKERFSIHSFIPDNKRCSLFYFLVSLSLQQCSETQGCNKIPNDSGEVDDWWDIRSKAWVMAACWVLTVVFRHGVNGISLLELCWKLIFVYQVFVSVY